MKQDRVSLLPAIVLLSASLAATSATAQTLGADALPTGGKLLAGQAVIQQTAARMDIRQDSQKIILNWNNFNIGAQAQVNFSQPNSNSIALNRVVTSDPSTIFGRLNANGQVFLINPNGIIFGAGSSVNVGGLVASTLNIKDGEFLNGNYRFTRDGSTNHIVNQGSLTASDQGYIALFAPTVSNQGVLSARFGSIALVAGDAVTLGLQEAGLPQLLNIRIEPATVNALVENQQIIRTEGGNLLFSARAIDGLMGQAINSGGVVEAGTIFKDGERIVLEGGTGFAQFSQTPQPSGTQPPPPGGTQPPPPGGTQPPPPGGTQPPPPGGIQPPPPNSGTINQTVQNSINQTISSVTSGATRSMTTAMNAPKPPVGPPPPGGMSGPIPMLPQTKTLLTMAMPGSAPMMTGAGGGNAPQQPFQPGGNPNQPLAQGNMPQQQFQPEMNQNQPLLQGGVPQQQFLQGSNTNQPLAQGNVPQQQLQQGNNPNQPLAQGNVPQQQLQQGNNPNQPLAQSNVPQQQLQQGNNPNQPLAQGNSPQQQPQQGNNPNQGIGPDGKNAPQANDKVAQGPAQKNSPDKPQEGKNASADDAAKSRQTKSEEKPGKSDKSDKSASEHAGKAGGSARFALLAAADVQRHQQRTELYKNALNILEQNPTMADIPACGAGAGTLCVPAPAEAPKTETATKAAAAKEVAARIPGQTKINLLPPTAIQRKVAYLIGNNDYKGAIPALETPIGDVEAIAAQLKQKLGYETNIIRNASKADIILTLKKAVDNATQDESVLIMYAGHGYQIDSTKQGYWIPTDASNQSPEKWVSNSDITKFMSAIPAKQVILISDSCFSGTLTGEQKMVATTGDKGDILARRSVLVMSSGGEEPVSDEGKDGHSIFAYTLIKQLKKVSDFSTGSQVFENVKSEVSQEYPQQPQLGAVTSAGHVTGGDYLFEINRQLRQGLK